MEYMDRKGGSNAVAEPFWSAFAECIPSVTYMESCVFVCEDFPKENQKLANKTTNIG